MSKPFTGDHAGGFVFDIEIARKARMDSESKNKEHGLKLISQDFLGSEKSRIPDLIESFVSLASFAVSGPDCESKKICRRFLLSVDSCGFKINLSDIKIIETEHWYRCIDVITLCRLIDISIWSLLEDGVIVWNWLVAHDNYDSA